MRIEEEKNVNVVEPTDTNFLDTFTDSDEELIDLTSEKLDELNKKLPSWSIEPPHSFLNKK